MDWLRILTSLSIAWAALALIWQVVVARGGGRTDFSEPRGSALRGLTYNFTVAMLPTRKESAKHHPVKFAVGIALHVGTLLALLHVVLLVLAPSWAAALEPIVVPLALLALPGGCYLLARRVGSPTLRAMSSPDDFIAIALVLGLLALSILHGLDIVGPAVLLCYAALLFGYLPLGKLRHLVFFFVARADYGRRLGLRGVYPISPPSPEQSRAELQ